VEIQTETIPTWTDFMRLCASDFTDVWHFRGALDNWVLETALERTARNWRIPLKEMPQIEQALLREFMRAYPPDASTPPPDNNDTLGWLSLMQHHGAPTRLLDWSYSPYVAAFFGLDALLRHGDENRKAAVWALSYKPLAAAQNLVPAHLGKAFQEYAMTREGQLFRTIFMDAEPPITFAPIVNPYRLHERLVLQQGVFLCQGNICLPFEENLLALPGIMEGGNIRKLMLPYSALSDAFRSLQSMNISHRTLFPGIDGFARSLQHRVDFLRAAVQRGTY
jgi:hypothetical protein